MSLFDTIGDYYWRDWAKRLPVRETGEDTLARYLTGLSRMLDDAPLTITTLSVTDRLLLLELLGFHRDAVAYELARVARSARDAALPGAAGGMVSALYAASAPIVAVAQAGLACIVRRKEKRQAQLEGDADKLTATIDRLWQDLLR